jgi:hypothetical protein
MRNLSRYSRPLARDFNHRPPGREAAGLKNRPRVSDSKTVITRLVIWGYIKILVM